MPRLTGYPDFLTVPEVAALVRVSSARMSFLLKKLLEPIGGIYKIGGKTIVHRTAVEQFLWLCQVCYGKPNYLRIGMDNYPNPYREEMANLPSAAAVQALFRRSKSSLPSLMQSLTVIGRREASARPLRPVAPVMRARCGALSPAPSSSASAKGSNGTAR